MDSEIREQLENRIKELNKELETMVPGSEEFESAVKSLKTLIDALSEVVNDDAQFHKMMIEEDLNQKKYDDDLYREKEKMREEKKTHRWQIGLKIGEIIIPLTVTVFLVLIGLKFEETGNIGSAFASFAINMIPKGKR